MVKRPRTRARREFGKLMPEALLAILSATARPLACPPNPYDRGATGTPATCSGPARFNNFYGAGEIDALAVVSARAAY
jgi:hypothetical protein